jgi:hypothetical protein
MTGRPRYALSNAGCATLARNEHREKLTAPEYAGEALVEGKRYRLNGWIRERNGKRILWLTFLGRKTKVTGEP